VTKSNNVRVALMSLGPLLLSTGNAFAEIRPCPDAALESQAYTVYYVTVVDIVDPVTIRVTTTGRPPIGTGLPGSIGGKRTVRLVNLVAPEEPSVAALALQELTRLCKGKQVNLYLSDIEPPPVLVTAEVAIEGRSVNAALLRPGHAQYAPLEPYAVGAHTECEWQNWEEYARMNRLGVWAAKSIDPE
jgi:endonuclease YncB( thermonuclease family)